MFNYLLSLIIICLQVQLSIQCLLYTILWYVYSVRSLYLTKISCTIATLVTSLIMLSRIVDNINVYVVCTQYPSDKYLLYS